MIKGTSRLISNVERKPREPWEGLEWRKHSLGVVEKNDLLERDHPAWSSAPKDSGVSWWYSPALLSEGVRKTANKQETCRGQRPPSVVAYKGTLPPEVWRKGESPLRSAESLRQEAEFKMREAGQARSGLYRTHETGHEALWLVKAPDLCFISLVCSPEDRAQALTHLRQALHLRATPQPLTV